MRYGAMAENPAERAIVAAGLLPLALTEGYAPAFGKAIQVAVEIGAFDAIGTEGATAAAVASACQTDARATEKLLNLLVAMRYLHRREDRYTLARHVRRWLLADAPNSVRDMVRMKELEWRWIAEMDGFVRSGEPIDVHATMSPGDWATYQRGMRAQANVLAPLLVRQVPVPKGATAMLDIGGSHGYFSVALCRRHPGLRAEVLDLPEAVAEAEPLLAREGMGERVRLRAGNALTDELGTDEYDLILAVSLVHHFTDEQNRELVARAARALRPAGCLAIVDLLRPSARSGSGQLARFYDLYFALPADPGCGPRRRSVPGRRRRACGRGSSGRCRSRARWGSSWPTDRASCLVRPPLHPAAASARGSAG